MPKIYFLALTISFDFSLEGNKDYYLLRKLKKKKKEIKEKN